MDTFNNNSKIKYFKKEMNNFILLLFNYFFFFFQAPFQWFVATCSQDNYIRMWQLSFDENNNNNNNQTNIDSTTLKLKRSSFALKLDQLQMNVDVELYSILLGHEEAIYGLCWYPNTGKNIIWKFFNKIMINLKDLKKAATTILSASMDKSMVLWTFDDNQKMFIDKV